MSEKRTRRSLLAGLGTTGAAASAGGFGRFSTVAAAESDPAFDPYDITAVGQFVERVLVEERLQKDNGPDSVTFADTLPEEHGLDRTQTEALADGLRPVTLSSVSPPAERGGSSSVPTLAALQEKWGWDTPAHIEDALQSIDARSSAKQRDDAVDPTGSSETFANVQEQVAVSVDYTAWRWQCRIDWEYDGTAILEESASDSVLYTNYDVAYGGTDRDERNIATENYEVTFQANFSNSAGTVCDPLQITCIDVGGSFNPVQTLRVTADGETELVRNSDDAWF